MAPALGAAASPPLSQSLVCRELRASRRHQAHLQAPGPRRRRKSRKSREAVPIPRPSPSSAFASRASPEASWRSWEALPPFSQASNSSPRAKIAEERESPGCYPGDTWPSSHRLCTAARAGRSARDARKASISPCRARLAGERESSGFCPGDTWPSPDAQALRAAAPGGRSTWNARNIRVMNSAPSPNDSGRSSGPIQVSRSDRRDPSPDAKRAILPFLFPALGGLLFGYDIGATSGALISIKDPVLSGTDWGSISATATGLIVSGSLAGALLGSALAFLVADPLGRRRELMLAALLYAAGAACTAGAPSLSILLLGRLIFGVGIGLAMHAAPMYIAETSPAPIRGTLISLKEGFIVGGILLGYLSGSLFIADVGGWREMFALGVPVAIAMGAGMAWLPPSPRWLLLRCSLCRDPSPSPLQPDSAPKAGSMGEGSQALGSAQTETELREGLLGGGDGAAFRGRAVAALQRLRGPGVPAADLEAEVDGILRTLDGEEGGEGEGKGEAGNGLRELFTGANGAALRIAGGLVVFQQITGQPSVLYYAASILQDAGFSGASDATKVSVLLGLFKLLMTGVAVVLVDSAGRRPLLLTGVSGLVLSLVALGTVYKLDFSAPLLSVAALLLYVGAYQVSFGPISWLMVSEIFALRVRGRAQSVATLLNFGSNAVVTFALPPIQESIGQAWTFYGFGAIGMIAIAFIFSTVPETKGLTLEQIQADLAPGGGSARHPV